MSAWALCSLQTVVSPWGRHNAAYAVPSSQNPAELGPMVYLSMPLKPSVAPTAPVGSPKPRARQAEANSVSPTLEQRQAAKGVAALQKVEWDEVARKEAVASVNKACQQRKGKGSGAGGGAGGGSPHTYTCLHVDDGAAANLLAEGGPAMWTAIHPKYWDHVKVYLQLKLANTNPEAANCGVDFLLTRDQWLDDVDVQALRKLGVVIWQFEQKQGDVVIIPAHVPHQVLHHRVSAPLRSRCDACNTLCRLTTGATGVVLVTEHPHRLGLRARAEPRVASQHPRARTSGEAPAQRHAGSRHRHAGVLPRA